jgi:peroxiredoxin family protein
MEVSIFFTFWGLSFLKKKKFSIFKPKLLLQKMFRFINRGVPLSRFNFLGLGPLMMKILMKQTKMPSLEELMSLARQLNVKFLACTTSCGVMGIAKDDLIADVDDFVGAATFLAEAKDAKFNLFI